MRYQIVAIAWLFPIVSIEIENYMWYTMTQLERNLMPLKAAIQPGELDQSEGGSACQLRHHGGKEGSNILSRKLPLFAGINSNSRAFWLTFSPASDSSR